MKNVKLIASDMDHTLLMENGKLPDGFFDYIDRLDAIPKGESFA